MISIEKRFLSKVNLSQNQLACWLWTSAKLSSGYGVFRFKNRMVCAHRIAYELFIGAIPKGLTIDHVCRNPSCVNPGHLEPVSMKENLLRGDGFGGENFRKTHCLKGHPLADKNLGIDPETGWRRCRTCSRENSRRYRRSSKYKKWYRNYAVQRKKHDIHT